MKANIDKDGLMTLIPENEIEEYAAIEWYNKLHQKKHIYYDEHGKEIYPFGKIIYPRRIDNDCWKDHLQYGRSKN